MTSTRTADYRLQRLDASQLALLNAWGIPVRLFAGEGVPIERTAVTELLGLLELQDTIAALARNAPQLFDYPDPGIVAIALSSDFHKGSGIPIGTTLRTRGVLVPQAVGTDVNCGMRVHLTGWTLEQVQPVLDQLERRLRPLFFQGGRHSRLVGGPAHPVTRHLREGDRLGAWVVLETPGHTPGHRSYWRPDDGVLILGDVLAHQHPVTQQVGLIEPLRRFTLDPAQNQASARRIAALRPQLVCFGHGPPLRDPDQLARFIERLGAL